LDPLVLILVLAAAVFHATWNAVVKHAGDRLLSMAVVMGMSTVIAIPVIIVMPLPDPASWPLLFGSLVIHTIYFLTLTKAYNVGDLSQVYPIARGSSPLYVAALGMWLAGEDLSFNEIAAVLVICFGIISLSLGNGLRGLERAPLFYAFVVGLTIGLYTYCDGLGVRNAGHPLSYIGWMFFLEGIPFGLFAIWRRRDGLVRRLQPIWKRGVIGGLIGTAAYGMVVWAMALTPMAHIAALRETSVIIAAFIGTRMLGEDGGRRRIAAAAIVAVGIVALQISANTN